MKTFPTALLLLAVLVSMIICSQCVPSPAALLFSIQALSDRAELLVPLGAFSPTGLNVSVDWGDGKTEIFTSATLNSTLATYIISHTYSVPGIYSVAVDQSGPGPLWMPTFGWNPSLSNGGWDMLATVRLINISSFGQLGTRSLRGALFNCSSDFTVPSSIPNTTTDLSFALANCPIFNRAIASWNLSRVTNLEGLFQRAYSFNQPISQWDTNLVTNVRNIFYEARAFNQPLVNWSTNALTSVTSAFHNALSFNQPLDSWNLSKVDQISWMFAGTPFNHSLASWDVSRVKIFQGMFWNASNFNHPLESWNMSSATDLASMFTYSDYNHPLNGWDVSKVIIFDGMFAGNTIFNHPLDQWDVGSGQQFQGMFSSASGFNQPLDMWNVSSATQMDNMFRSASAFNQSLTTWCAPKITVRPSLFANQSKLALQFEPRWGQPCRVRLSLVIPTNSSVVILQPNTTSVITDPIVASNVTLVVPVVTTVISTSGTVEVQNCFSFEGQVEVPLLGDPWKVGNNNLTLISTTRPDCFNVSITKVFVTTSEVYSECNQPGVVVSSQALVESSSLILLFSSTYPENSVNSKCSAPQVSTEPLPIGLIAGVVAGAVALIIIVTTTTVCIRKRRMKREQGRLRKKQVEMNNLK